MRKVSAMLAVVTPKSAAAAKLGCATTSARTKDALDEILPKPLILRKSFSTAAAAVCKAKLSSPDNTKIYFSPDPPKPTVLRVLGKFFNAARISASTTCLRGRNPRASSNTVSVALRVSAAPEPTKGSLPAAPPPMVV